jgi:GTPase SAR1 family protein
MTTVTLSLISHTNVGKTTLARTLLRREIGEVRDQPHVTTIAEAHPLIETDRARLLLWDTPGFGDTVRLMKRLRHEHDPIGWFLHQVWDRLRDRPLWCSQEAVRNVRDEADVVLYLVNATEDPESAGYLKHELELLSWMNRPVLIVLNQVGTDDAARTVERWRTYLASFAVVRGVLSLDAFSRAWVEESLVLERVVDLLDGEKRIAMTDLVRAWNDRNLGVFEVSVDAIAQYLAVLAVDREPIGDRSENLSWLRERLQDLRALSRVDRERAMGAMFDRVQATTRRLMDRLIELHQLTGASKAQVERRLEDAALQGNDALNPTTGAIAGGAVSGLLAGLGADVLAGGLSLGGGAIIGAMFGALGGYAFGGAYKLATGGESGIQLQTAALDRLTREALLRYLIVAHHGRGRGDYTDVDYPVHWAADVDAELERHRETLHEAWRVAGRERRDSPEPVAEHLRLVLRDMLRDVLRQRYPGATVLAERATMAPRAPGSPAAPI